MNKVMIIGNLTHDPDVRQTNNGTSLATFSIAVNRGKSDDRETEYFDVTVFGTLADHCGKYLTKGKKVAVSGSIHLNKFETKDGKTYSSLKITATDIEFLSPKD